jgi:LDH2 family malate/lactate/ureidoglycolate dehydrogenase
MVGVSRSTHFGMGALYALQAIEKNFVSMIFTNSSPAIAMWGGRTAFLGASPVAAGVPGGKSAPFVMDMAMTVIARGKIRLAAMRGEPIADGLALDVDGNPTTDAAKAFEGVCLPFGGVKGSVLGTMMDLMSGVLTGANYGGDVKSLYFDHSEPQNVGHLFFAIRPDLFMAMTDFEARMEEFNRRIKALPRAAGCDEILMPGEPEARTEARRAAEGIPVTDNVLADLTKVAEDRGIAPLSGAA